MNQFHICLLTKKHFDATSTKKKFTSVRPIFGRQKCEASDWTESWEHHAENMIIVDLQFLSFLLVPSENSTTDIIQLQ